jgi:flagellar FliL protein
MAKANARDEDDEAAAAPAKSGSKKLLLMVLAGVLLLGVSIAGTVLVTKSMLGGGATAESADEEESTAKAEHAKPEDKKKKKGDKKGDKKAKGEHGDAKPAVYLSLEPPFVVNAEGQGNTHYLQVSMDVLARDPAVIETMKKHMPVIRNNLIMLLSSQKQAEVSTREGKEKLRADALAEIQKVLKEQTGEPGVDAVYFTIFVMQ